MTESTEPPGGSEEPPRDVRARRAWRIALWGGAGLGGLLAVLQALGGGSGTDGLRVALLGLLLTTMVGAAYAILTGAIDSVRDRPVGRERVVAAAALAILALLLPVMIIGVSS